jgi:hypothetical protein
MKRRLLGARLHAYSRSDPMIMTHYMELLTSPMNLLLFMAIPVALAETLAITEFYVLYKNGAEGPARTLNRLAGIALGVYFTGVFVYLMATAVLPISQAGQWRGWIDVLAVGAYLAGVVPLGLIALLELGLVWRNRSAREKLGLHAALISIFLVVGHVAMVAGMMDPRLGGYQAPAANGGHAGHSGH